MEYFQFLDLKQTFDILQLFTEFQDELIEQGKHIRKTYSNENVKTQEQNQHINGKVIKYTDAHSEIHIHLHDYTRLTKPETVQLRFCVLLLIEHGRCFQQAFLPWNRTEIRSKRRQYSTIATTN